MFGRDVLSRHIPVFTDFGQPSYNHQRESLRSGFGYRGVCSALAGASRGISLLVARTERRQRLAPGAALRALDGTAWWLSNDVFAHCTHKSKVERLSPNCVDGVLSSGLMAYDGSYRPTSYLAIGLRIVLYRRSWPCTEVVTERLGERSHEFGAVIR